MVPAPSSVIPGDYESDTEIRLFRERFGECLPFNLNVDVDASGSTGTVPAGTAVNSYFVHADQTNTTSGGIPLAGSIVFEERLIGLATSDTTLDASDIYLPASGTSYPTGYTHRGINMVTSDLASFAAFVLDLDFTVFDVTDQVRVLTQAGNNYLFYNIEFQRIGSRLALEGQFDSAPIPARLRRMTRFGNPVRIGDCLISDNDAHLTWYDLNQRQRDPHREVDIVNALGSRILTLGQPRALLVPAEKTSDAGSSFPHELDHYKCYDVRRGRAPRLSVDMEDQWEVYSDIILKPRLFCVPVAKHVQSGSVEPLRNGTDHLTIYKIKGLGVTQDLSAEDQFGEWTLRTRETAFLGISTLKQDFRVLKKK